VAKPAAAGSDFASVAFANHGPSEEGVWKISVSESVDVSEPLDESSDFASLMATMANMITIAGHVDLMACNLASVSPEFIGRLESHFRVDFTASMNATGNDNDGGDWEMETDGVDVVKLYFEEHKLQKYGETMGSEFWGFVKGAAVGAVFVAAVCATGGAAGAMAGASCALNATAAVAATATGTAAAGTAVVITTQAGAVATGAAFCGVVGAIAEDGGGCMAREVADTVQSAIDNESQRLDEEQAERDKEFNKANGIHTDTAKENVAYTTAGLASDQVNSKSAKPIRDFFHNSTAALCAKFAMEVYTTPSQRAEKIDGYCLLKAMPSHDRMVAYYSQSHKSLIVSYRGTLLNGEDCWSDLELFLSNDTSRVPAAVSFFENAVANAPNCRRVRLTGHSLGGATAMLTLRRVQDMHRGKLEPSHIFNPFMSHNLDSGKQDAIIGALSGGRLDVTVHRILNDAASSGTRFSQLPAKVVNYKGTAAMGPMEAHRMHNFI
jgi:hypothetical protein